MKRHIMNIVNFVRGCEPRYEVDLLAPVIKELETDRRFGLEDTFLLQYDALLRDDMVAAFAGCGEETELGLWFEMCRALTEKVGIAWRGRPGYDWDWFVDPGFLEAYTPAEREALIDEAFRLFRERFGRYPEVAGSWLLDAHSMRYMAEKYGMKAFIICKEQINTDAYTLWGGPYSGGYFPSVNNALCPASTEENQIPVPVFRMLGIDPIYSYNGEGRYYPPIASGVYTMEPAWQLAQDPDVMDWFFREYYENPCLNYSHATTGQENSFGWEGFGRGYEMQIGKLKSLSDRGIVSVEQLGKTGEAFRKSFPLTPPSALLALTDWAKAGYRSVWYHSRFYRADLFVEKGRLTFRDLMKFDERLPERYLSAPCAEWSATYENLPVVDAHRWATANDAAHEAAIAFPGEVLSLSAEADDARGSLTVTAKMRSGGEILVTFSEREVTVQGAGSLLLIPAAAKAKIRPTSHGFDFSYEGYDYSVASSSQPISEGENYRIPEKDGKITLRMDL